MINLTTFFDNNAKTSKDLTHLNAYEHNAKTVKLPPDMTYLLNEYGGINIENGLFRIHTWGSSFYWTQICRHFFKSHADIIYCYGFDWMGRNYAIDMKDAHKMYLLDYATGEVFELEQNIEGFFNEDLVEYKYDTLATDTFMQLPENERIKLRFDNCFSFKIPLFLGGEDIAENYEVMDMEVCWELNYQLFAEIENLPEGTLIDKINFI